MLECKSGGQFDWLCTATCPRRSGPFGYGPAGSLDRVAETDDPELIPRDEFATPLDMLHVT